MHTFGFRFSTMNSADKYSLGKSELVFIFDVHLHGEASSCRERVCVCVDRKCKFMSRIYQWLSL